MQINFEFLSWSSSQLLLYELLPPLRHTNTTDAHTSISFYLTNYFQFIQELWSIQKGYYFKILILCNVFFFFKNDMVLLFVCLCQIAPSTWISLSADESSLTQFVFLISNSCLSFSLVAPSVAQK